MGEEEAPRLVGAREGSPAGVSRPSSNHRPRPNIHVLVHGVPLRRLQVTGRGACVGSKARRGGMKALPQSPEKTFAEPLSLSLSVLVSGGQVDRQT